MSAIDNYGEFDLPEEKTRIEVVEDPVKTVLSCYKWFVELILKENPLVSIDQIYQTAVKTLDGKEKLNFTAKEIERIVKQSDVDRYANLFLSALHNQTNLKTLIINSPNFMTIGYELKNNKTLVIGPKINVDPAYQFTNGTVINYGKSECHMYDSNKKPAFFMNYGEIGYLITQNGGICLNKNIIYDIGKDEITCINIGYPIQIFDSDKQEKIQENTIYHKNSNIAMTQINRSLIQKLEEISFLETLQELSYEQQFEKVDKVDFNKFEQELKEIVEEIYESQHKI